MIIKNEKIKKKILILSFESKEAMDHRKFTEEVSKATGLEKQDCEAFLVSFLNVLEDAVCEGDIVSVPAFGTFEPRKRNERVMSHPSAPGKRLLIPPKLVISFKPSSILKEKINNNKVADE